MASATTHSSGVDDLLTLLLHRWARRSPDAVAVTAPDGRYTFAELADRVRHLAAGLAASGVERGSAVGLCLGRSVESVPALLAVWWLGATAVPTDDRHPVARLKLVLEDAGVRVVVGDRLPDGAAPRHAARLGGADLDRLAATAQPAPCPPVRDEDHAYVVYTSGTTGWPKGVEVGYGNLAAFLAALATLELTPGGVGINAVSPAFDGWLWCTLLYLLHGQGVALVDPTADGPTLAETIAALQPSTVCLTPSLLATCERDLPSAEVLVVAGEVCPPVLAERFRHGRRMLNVYGPTETTIAATWADSARGDDVTTIGRPLPGYRAYVLDERRRPVPDGTVGELHIGGPGVAAGYRNSPGLTARRFLPDPFAGQAARMYRTGDAVVRREDGQLEYRGRLDDQVKVRGHRVELGEVERVAGAEADVLAAAAFAGRAGDTVGVGIVVAPGADEHAVAARVRARCARRLPDAMVPLVHPVPALPTSPTGKVDRAALAEAARVTTTGRAPGTELERLVCRTWSTVLGHEVTDVDTGFFELGGHSLLAAKAVAALRAETGLSLSVRELLANPTAARLARTLERMSPKHAETATRGRWLVPFDGPPGDRPVLLCLPQAGAGCGQFRAWQRTLGSTVAVVGVQLPGREERFGEPPVPTVAEAVRAMAAEAVELLPATAPVAVYGHSFGGLLGYELTRALQAAGRPPLALVVGACRPPHHWVGAGRGLVADGTELLRLLDQRRLGDLDPDTKDLVLGLMRQDARLSLTYADPAGARVGCPVWAWSGAEDETVTPAQAAGWREYTEAECVEQTFPGGHYFCFDSGDSVPHRLGELLARAGRRGEVTA